MDSISTPSAFRPAGWHQAYDTITGRRLVEATVTRDVNHPSILFWDNGNEGGWNRDLDGDFARFDPQRRALLHPWEIFNGIDTKHYPGYALLQERCAGPNVFFPTEFLHGLYDGGGAAALENFWQVMRTSKLCAGGFIWVFADEAVKRIDRNGQLDTHGNMAPDGVVGPYHQKEASFYAIKEIWSPLVIPLKNLPADFAGQFPLENRYDFTDASQCRFTWALRRFPRPEEHRSGFSLLDHGMASLVQPIPPGHTGTLDLALPSTWRQADALALRANGPDGQEVWTWVWPVAPRPAVPDAAFAAAPPQASETPEFLNVQAGPLAVRFDKQTGLIAAVARGDQRFSLVNGPRLAIGTASPTSLTSRPDGADFVIDARYAGNLQSVQYRLHNTGWIDVSYAYALDGGHDFFGVSFDYPEKKVQAMRWLGQGPCRVWKNRLAGGTFGVWENRYNDTITGHAGWVYPEFKGYYQAVRWLQLQTTEGPITAVLHTDNVCSGALSGSAAGKSPWPHRRLFSRCRALFPARDPADWHQVPTRPGPRAAKPATGCGRRLPWRYQSLFRRLAPCALTATPRSASRPALASSIDFRNAAVFGFASTPAHGNLSTRFPVLISREACMSDPTLPSSPLPPPCSAPSGPTSFVLPAWAQEMRDLFKSGAVVQFILHGNVFDLVRTASDKAPQYRPLKDFLNDVMFASYDVILHYDRGRGIRALRGADDWGNWLEQFAGDDAAALARAREPAKALELIDRYLLRSLNLRAVRGKDASAPRIALVIDFAEFVVPAGNPLSLGGEFSATIVRVLGWANDPAILQSNIATVLLTEQLHDINSLVVENPHAAKLKIPLPDETDMLAYLQSLTATRFPELPAKCEVPVPMLARRLSGLSRVGALTVVSRALSNGQAITSQWLTGMKKDAIERECQGLLEFIESSFTLENLSGSEAVKAWLREDAQLLRRGAAYALPMGYLISGRIGTGKTFLVTCWAGELGVPCVVFKNFRDRWVGATESNLEKIFSVLRALGQVVVFVDEADQMAGKREGGDNDSGLSGRVYAMLAKEMSDTRNRGRIIWVFATSRPDLLEVDLKRQGRLDVHIPLFPPQSAEEMRALLQSVARKLHFPVAAADIPDLPGGVVLGGNEIEGVLVRALRQYELSPEPRKPLKEILAAVFQEVRPSAHTRKLEYMDLVAVKECTDARFLPPSYRDLTPEQIETRLAELRRFMA